jgi:hypothetical protein
MQKYNVYGKDNYGYLCCGEEEPEDSGSYYRVEDVETQIADLKRQLADKSNLSEVKEWQRKFSVVAEKNVELEARALAAETRCTDNLKKWGAAVKELRVQMERAERAENLAVWAARGAGTSLLVMSGHIDSLTHDNMAVRIEHNCADADILRALFEASGIGG